MSKDEWAQEAKQVVKAAIVRSGLTYEQLAGRMQKLGVRETLPSIKNKLSRGTFTFAFVLQVMRALEKDRIELG